MNNLINEAVELIRQADCFLIGAGAGLGVDSGQPDYRGTKGFWNHYPMLEQLGYDYKRISDCNLFIENPKLAWGFYGHCLSLYRSTIPHSGYNILQQLIDSKKDKSFVYTSNVDGHFRKAGFNDNALYECHGNIHLLQCSTNCNNTVWSADDFQPDVDPETFLLRNEPPTCPYCHKPARPNILFFYDGYWCGKVPNAQHQAYWQWDTRTAGLNVLAIELGAGDEVPFVQMQCGKAPKRIRINPSDMPVDENTLHLKMGAKQAMEEIGAQLRLPTT